MTTTLQPLNKNLKIVEDDGTPTEYFMRLLQDRGLLQGNDHDTLIELTKRKLNTTAPIQGGGDLTADRTFSLADSGVIAGVYGDATHVPTITVDAHGLVDTVTLTPISVGSSLTVKDEGTTLTSAATSLNFVGSNVVATAVGAAVTVTISGVSSSRQVLTGTGLSGGGDLSADRTISLANTAVTPGTYTLATITVDAQGRITSASNGVAPSNPIYAPLTNGDPTTPLIMFDSAGAVILVQVA